MVGRCGKRLTGPQSEGYRRSYPEDEELSNHQRAKIYPAFAIVTTGGADLLAGIFCQDLKVFIEMKGASFVSRMLIVVSSSCRTSGFLSPVAVLLFAQSSSDAVAGDMLLGRRGNCSAFRW